MKIFWTSAWRIAFRELHRLLRDPNLVLILFIAPLAYTGLYGSIYLKKVEEAVPVDIVDLDASPLSRDLIREIDALQYVEVRQVGTSENEAEKAMLSNRTQAWVMIPVGFSRDLRYGRGVTIPLVMSPGRLLVLSDVGIGISQTAATFGAKVRAGILARQGIPVFQNPDFATPIGFTYTSLFNPWLTYGDMILPALMAVIFLQLVLIGSAGATASEWASGSWPDLFAISETRTEPAVFGKLWMFISVFLAFAVLLRISVVPLFNIQIRGDGLLLLILLLLAFWAAAGMGLFVGSFLRFRTTAFVVLGFTSYPFFLLSGYAWPEAQMALPLRILSRFLPTTPFLQGVNLLTQMENGWEVLWPQLLNLGGLGVLFSALAVWRFRAIYDQQHFRTSDSGPCRNPLLGRAPER